MHVKAQPAPRRERFPLQAKRPCNLRSLELRCAAKGRAYLTSIFYRGECSNLSFFFSFSFFGLWSRLRALLKLLRHSFSPCSRAQNSEESYHRIVLADFSFDELHLLMSKLGLKKKPGRTFFALLKLALLFPRLTRARLRLCFDICRRDHRSGERDGECAVANISTFALFYFPFAGKLLTLLLTSRPTRTFGRRSRTGKG